MATATNQIYSDTNLRIDERVHQKVKQNIILRYFTWFTRIILAIGFVPPSLTKILGNRFTQISIDNPIGFFFEALYQTGFYWRFLGLCQISAAILLLIPRTSTLGALMFLPIILNIFIITVSMDFHGTPIITGLMLLANIYLLCWDYDKLKPILRK